MNQISNQFYLIHFQCFKLFSDSLQLDPNIDLSSSFPNFATATTKPAWNPFQAHSLNNTTDIRSNSQVTYKDLINMNKNIIDNMRYLDSKLNRIEQKMDNFLSSSSKSMHTIPQTNKRTMPSSEGKSSSSSKKKKKILGPSPFRTSQMPVPGKVRFMCPFNHKDCPIRKKIIQIEKKWADEKKEITKVGICEMQDTKCEFENCCHHMFNFRVNKADEIRDIYFKDLWFNYCVPVSADILSSQHKNQIRKHADSHGIDSSACFIALTKISNK